MPAYKASELSTFIYLKPWFTYFKSFPQVYACQHIVYRYTVNIAVIKHCMKIDYMKPSGWKRVQIKDRTKNKQGLPTQLAMERQLIKSIRYA